MNDRQFAYRTIAEVSKGDDEQEQIVEFDWDGGDEEISLYFEDRYIRFNAKDLTRVIKELVLMELT